MIADGHIDEILRPEVKAELENRACGNAGLDRQPCGEQHALFGKGGGRHHDAEANAVLTVFNLGIDNGNAALIGNAIEHRSALIAFKGKRSIVENEPYCKPVRLIAAAYSNGNIHRAAGADSDARHAESGACALRLKRGGGKGKQHQYCGGNKRRGDSFHWKQPFFRIRWNVRDRSFAHGEVRTNQQNNYTL